MSQYHSRRHKKTKAKPKSLANTPFPFPASHSNAVIPTRTRCSMQYAFLGTAATSTGYTETVWSGTNATDPGGGSDTRQPVGFDEMAVWYNNFVVHKARIEIQASMSSSNVAPVATLVGGDLTLFANESSSALTLQASAISQPGAKFARMAMGQITHMSLEGSSASVLGIPHMGNDNFIGTTASGPASFNWYFHFGRSADVAYTGISIEYTLRIIYDIEFFNRKMIELPTFQAANRKFVLENQKSWIGSGKALTSDSKEGKGNDFKDIERTDGKTLSTVSAGPRPSQSSLVMSSSLVLPEKARDYAWVKLPTPLSKN